MLNPEKLSYLELMLISDIGAISVRRLLDKFGCPENIFAASLNKLIGVESISRKLAKNIIQRKHRTSLDGQLRLIDRYKIKILTLHDDSYPENLKSIYDPPIILFIKGEFLPCDYFSVAIVGTRMCSVYGREMADKIASQLAEKGMTIISGGARGIDTCAHQAALRISGRTVAVLGCGLDIVYPLENKKLFDTIAQNGALVSEFPLGTQPEKRNFPMRNRIVSGLSLGVVVIEAPQRSGALITVGHAAEQGREVFSVPHPAGRFTSSGTNQLLREGAKLVENADDILEELEGSIRHRLGRIGPAHTQEQKCTSVDSDLKLSGDEERIYNLLSDKSLHIDDIVTSSELTIGAVFNILMQLELKKIIKQLPGKIFVRA